ncbi:hypothetical protein BDP27DRAFT_1016215 [Rhodocollybia butyracea]|uniref:AMP-activated protein kinase glycogen-binding domain-containing protein n=1 Tax=Rhodocollybia butyracea TaxID=206335 RepID=A0A9P5PM97_9AGAR|nr:hypothetical protein BDP27DRAFT_1016215 [Rhodocollybia butyracea]
MGNSQSTPPNTNLPPGSRRFGSPRPRTSSSANPDLQSPRRSSSLRATMPRPSSPSSSVQSAHVTHTSSLRSPRSPGVRSGRSRLSSDSKDREKEKEKEREKEGRRYVHRSLRTKKKSLELPDLASLNVTQVAHAIPNVLSDSPTQDTPPSNENGDAEDPEDTVTDDAVTEDIDPETGFRRMIIRSTMPFPPNLQQTLVSRALAQAATSSSTTSSTAVTRSTTSSKIPSGQRINPRASEGETTYLVKISWHGGGSEVFLTRAGDDDWAGKRVMEQETIVAEESVSGSSDTQAQGSQPGPTFSTIIALPRGTHHLRFIVDGQNRVADDLPTAVDDNGSLANYVSVGLGDMSPSEGAGANPVLVPLSDAILNVREGGNAEGDAEFIIEGEVDSDAILRQPDIIQSSGPASVLIERIERRASHSSFWSEHDNDSDTAQTRPPSLSSSPSGAGLAGARAGLGMTPATDAAANSHSNTTPTKPKPRKPYTPQWTCDIPLELLEAAAEEEAYLAYSNEVENARSSNQRIHITGFVPLPNIPPAPASRDISKN